MKLHVFPASPNSRKVMVVNRLTGLNVPEAIVNLQAGEQKAPQIMELNPNGRIPILELADGSSLWESNVIMNRMAGMAKHALWPQSDIRYEILRWQFWEACHFTPASARFISKHLFGDDSVDIPAATENFRRFADVLDGHLAGRDWLVDGGMTTADLAVAAPLTFRAQCQYPMDGYPNIAKWLAKIEALPGWVAVDQMLQAA